ncbi:AMP-binding protein [Streptomyces coeruleoprunus]|uniref:AMP-binding protein n=1 Tax=Streptomyces coeruleoprunus TaxID=285563 RepID=A0ABV9X9P7_9ACTN
MYKTPLPPFVSYVDSLLASLARDPGRTAVVDADGRRTSAGELHDAIHRLAAALADRGVGRGSTVTLLSGNRSEALTARYAANLLGARVTFLYEGMAPEVLARIADHVDTHVLLVDPACGATAAGVLDRVRPPEVLAFGPSPLAEDLLALSAAYVGRRVRGAARAEDDWCIRHTGGTTGVPKGVRMAHGPYQRSLHAWSDATGKRFLACTSLAHLAGLFADRTLLAGGRVVLRQGFDPADVLATVARERITDLWLLPPLLYRLLDEPSLPSTDVSSLRRIAYGGCAASPARLRQAAEVFGPVLHGWYGQTEAGLITHVPPDEHHVTGEGGQVTVGRPAPGVEVAVRDEGGGLRPPGGVGEIHVRSRQVMSGYWKQPELTAEVLRDGWVRTGDAGYADEDGYLYIVDRIKDMIIVVGGHVYPAELEEMLLTHPAVEHCAVFGVPGRDGVEEVHAAVVHAAGSVRPDLAGVRAFVTAHKGAMYAPAALHTLGRIPLTPAGKPDRKQLRALAGCGEA